MASPDNTRYGLPPQRDPFEPFPAEVPWDTPVAELAWWLERKCQRCGHSGYYPLRLLAAEHGWQLTLRRIVPRLRCSNCGARPDHIHLVNDAAGELGRFGAKVQHLDLLPGPT